jgi:hypothetical protein
VPAHVDAIFSAVATLRVYFGQIVFSRSHWIRAGDWLRNEIQSRMVGLACHSDAQLGSWFNEELCRAPLYILREPGLPPGRLDQPLPIPAEIERCGTFDAPKTEGVPVEWLDAIDHYATKLLAALSEYEDASWTKVSLERRIGKHGKVDNNMSPASADRQPGARNDDPMLTFHITHQAAFIEFERIKHPVKHSVAEAFKKMYEANGQPVGLTSILGDKPTRVLQKLPQELQAIVAKADGNKGYRLTIS